MRPDGSTLSPSPRPAVTAWKSSPLPKSQSSDVNGMQNVIISRGAGSPSTCRPAWLEVREMSCPVPSLHSSPFGCSTHRRGATRAWRALRRSQHWWAGRKVGDTSGRWVTLQEGPILHKTLPPRCLMKARWLRACPTHPARHAGMGTGLPSGEERAPGHHALLRTSFQEPGGEEEKTHPGDGRGRPRAPSPAGHHHAGLRAAAGSTSITRWECCTPGEPRAELGIQGGSGTTAKKSPAVYFLLRFPVPVPGINA